MLGNKICMSMVRRMGSEYGDDVTKSNKKEDMMLSRKLRVLERHERIAEHVIKKTIQEAERLKHCVGDQTCLAPDLKCYDLKKYLNKTSRYGGTKENYSKEDHCRRAGRNKEHRIGVTLPPIRERRQSSCGQGSKEQRRERRPRTLPNIHHAGRTALTLRQLRQPVMSSQQMKVEATLQHHKQDLDLKMKLKTLQWKERFLLKLEADFGKSSETEHRPTETEE